MVSLRPPRSSLWAVLPIALLAGCNRAPQTTRLDYQMGDRVTLGSLSYNVIETAWQSQLGNEFKMRIPERRFLLITVSVTNGGGREISVPLLSLENQSGALTLESSDGDSVEGWFGLLRTLNPAQTQQGRLLFDVPLGSYRLRLSNGGDPGSEKFGWVAIPLHMEPETPSTPMPEPTPGK